MRRARPGEQVQTLDGQTRTLDEQMLVIEDAAGPTSIAGVMGGARSEVHDGTTRVLSEVASWNGANIHRTSLALGLRSEASSRFEKGLQPEQAMRAQALATQADDRALRRARARPARSTSAGPGPAADRRSGCATRASPRCSASTIAARALPRRSSSRSSSRSPDADDGLDVTVPAFRRADITREADLIEEVARLDGLDRDARDAAGHAQTAAAALAVGGGRARRRRPGTADAPPALRRRAADALAAQGLHEIVGWSFAGPED